MFNIVAAIIEYEDKILCMQRGKDKHEYTSFKWEFRGGKIEEGETKENALRREILEEMDLQVKIQNHFCDIHYRYPDFVLNMNCYKCSVSKKELKLNVHNYFKWLNKYDFKEMYWALVDKPIIDKLMEDK